MTFHVFRKVHLSSLSQPAIHLIHWLILEWFGLHLPIHLLCYFLAPIKAPPSDDHHKTAQALKYMIEHDGAGSWPPRATFRDTWPEELQPYHDIYIELAPSIPCVELSEDDQVNYNRCLAFRKRMQEMLDERVDTPAVKALLSDTGLSPDVWNGFYACIALSRHAYRWGTSPIVKLAQQDKIIHLPSQLDIPWPYLLQRFGLSSQGGNMMSHLFCNFNAQDQLVYSISTGMTPDIVSAEYHFGRILPAMEKLALPIYHSIINSITAFAQNDLPTTLASLKSINTHLRPTLKSYYTTLVDTKIPRSVWLSYVQGIQGWAAGTLIDGIYTEYDGLGGSQLPFPQVVDAFLGLEPYLSEEKRGKYVPEAQRAFIASVKRYSFREEARRRGEGEVEKEMEEMVRQMRVFRSAHRVRAKSYLSAPAEGRQIMTAGTSVESVAVQGLGAVLELVDVILLGRLKQTV